MRWCCRKRPRATSLTFLPTTTYSAHYIVDPALRRAIEDFLKRERAYVAAAHEELADAAPFRKG